MLQLRGHSWVTGLGEIKWDRAGELQWKGGKGNAAVFLVPTITMLGRIRGE